MLFHVVYMLPVFYRPAVGYVRLVCCLFVAAFGGTRTCVISLSAMFMLILCLFRGGGSAYQSWAGCLLLVLSVFRSASLNRVSLLNFSWCGGVRCRGVRCRAVR